MVRHLFACILVLFGATSAFAFQKVGLDRIDAMVGMSASGDWPHMLMEKTAATGVKHIKVWICWDCVDREGPFAEMPVGGNGFLVVPGIRTEGWHRYDVGALDRVMEEAERAGLTVALGIHGPPRWPRGDKACDYDWGTVAPCGIIQQSHFPIFRDALYDVTFYLSQRYPQVEYWLLYNEPNLPYAFLPEGPRLGSLLDLYMHLVYEPMSEALRDSGGAFHKLVGPEITAQDVRNDFGETRWIEDWIVPLLERYPNHFDVIGVHSYTIDAHQTLDRMERLKQALNAHPLATQRVWITEFDFGTEKESLTRTDANRFVNLLKLYSNQWWERSYYFSMMGPLVSADRETFGAPKPFYWLFALIAQYLN